MFFIIYAAIDALPPPNDFDVVNISEQIPGPGLMFIEGGRLTMGRVEEDVMSDWNNISKTVTVSSFYIDETEVRNVDYVEYLEWIKKLGAFNGALAIAPNGCWRARHASDLYRVKKEVLKVCKSECKSNNCEVVDVNGTSTFINEGKGSSSSSSVRTSTNYSPYYYNFFGALSPVRGTKTNTIKPDFIWNCSLEQTMGMVAGPPYQKEVQEFDESLPESIKSSYTMSTYENNTGIKWRLTFHDPKIGFEIVVDVGVRGDKFRDIIVLGYRLLASNDIISS